MAKNKKQKLGNANEHQEEFASETNVNNAANAVNNAARKNNANPSNR
ncbi:hypothetical protein ACF3MZ_01740 [Paenibacillaceae bacterium WGS1546]